MYVPRGRYEVPIRTASAKLAGLAMIGTCPDCPRAFSALTGVWLWSFVFYLESTLCLCRFICFFNEEYLIAPVDFIAPCGGTKEWGRRDLRIPPSPPSGLPPFQPWGIAAAGYWAAAGLCQYRIPVSGAIVRRHFDVRIGCFVFDPVSFAFQSVLFGLYCTFFIIGWKKDAVCLAFTHVFFDYR